ncbi:4291_t:CDS:2 [Funneliformis caledonium]|uniref:4291_t:CDS:1 n=1 Tax=Funneliformis caledonium TaxID=1117310 RepID=A0A9N8YTL7_9GLOM|nr:4291_t:CDS:2 [Funneliformis caledonium]
MSYRGGYCSFEFKLENVLKVTEKIYSPPFATSTCRHWVLIFDPYTNDPKTYQILLCTILNKESDRLADTFLPLKVILKSPSGDILHEVSTNDKIFNKTGLFLVHKRPRSSLLNNIIINIQFSDVRFTKVPPKMPFGTKQVAENLVHAWSHELNKPDRGDVRFKVQDKFIYASSSILATRSDYFRTMFEGDWIECNKQGISANDNENRHKYEIEITDFDYETVLAMLHFLYTDEANFVNYSLDNIWNLFSISDKYFVDELRQRIKIHIIDLLNERNAAEMLFKYAWKWPDLKDIIITFNVEHFLKIRKTRGFKQIVSSKSDYPMYHEILEEMILELYSEDENL